MTHFADGPAKGAHAVHRFCLGNAFALPSRRRVAKQLEAQSNGESDIAREGQASTERTEGGRLCLVILFPGHGKGGLGRRLPNHATLEPLVISNPGRCDVIGLRLLVALGDPHLFLGDIPTRMDWSKSPMRFRLRFSFALFGFSRLSRFFKTVFGMRQCCRRLRGRRACADPAVVASCRRCGAGAHLSGIELPR